MALLELNVKTEDVSVQCIVGERGVLSASCDWLNYMQSGNGRFI